MRWSTERLPNVKKIMDNYGLLGRVLDRNQVKMSASGSPCTYWRNQAISQTSILPVGKTKCYCWSAPDGTATGADSQQSQPDRKHFLCSGAGYLPGYQKYGYTEIVLSTPSTLTKSSSDLVIGGTRGSAYTLSGSSLVATLTSERFALTTFKDVNYFLVNDVMDADKNRVEYEYSTNDTTWVSLTMTAYTNSDVANRQATFTIPAGTQYIRFRVTLRKRTSAAPSPKWNSVRFRYRKFPTLYEIDPRFNVQMPAFLAAREQQTKSIEATEYGWGVKFPLEWWVLPDADVQNVDVISFLQGHYSGYRFETKNLREFTYGSSLQVLHKSFESIYIRDKHDLMGIIHYLL